MVANNEVVVIFVCTIFGIVLEVAERIPVEIDEEFKILVVIPVKFKVVELILVQVILGIVDVVQNKLPALINPVTNSAALVIPVVNLPVPLTSKLKPGEVVLIPTLPSVVNIFPIVFELNTLVIPESTLSVLVFQLLFH